MNHECVTYAEQLNLYPADNLMAYHAPANLTQASDHSLPVLKRLKNLVCSQMDQ